MLGTSLVRSIVNSTNRRSTVRKQRNASLSWAVPLVKSHHVGDEIDQGRRLDEYWFPRRVHCNFCIHDAPAPPASLCPLQEVGDESQLAAVLDPYPVYRGIWAVHQNEAYGDKVGGSDAAACAHSSYILPLMRFDSP